jgi:hypothetical protein
MKIKHTPIPLSLSLSHAETTDTLSLKILIANFCNSGILDPLKKNSTKHIIMLTFLLQQGKNKDFFVGGEISLKGRSLTFCNDF